MYQSKLLAILSKEHMLECHKFMKEHKEIRVKSVMERQKKTYNKLWQEKYQSGNSKCCVDNLSSQPLLPAQEIVLSHDRLSNGM